MSPSPVPGQFQHIDISQFERMNGTADIFPAVARVFVDLLPSWLEEVQQGAESADVALLGDKLHKMKGCCGMMGAAALSQEIAALEKRMAELGVNGCTTQLGDLLRKIREVEAEVAPLARTGDDSWRPSQRARSVSFKP